WSSKSGGPLPPWRSRMSPSRTRIVVSVKPSKNMIFSRVRRVARSLRVGRDLHGRDLVRVLHGLATLDLVDVFHALDDLPPDGVLAIEETRVVEHDEELAV